MQDSSGAIEVLVPIGTVAPPVGSRAHVEGRIGVAYGAPRLKADRLDTAGSGPVPAALVLHGPPGEANEWRLATISGRVDSVHKLGDRWRADIRVGSALVAIVGQPGSGIPSTALVEGRDATVTGIVRRPFPTATDRRFAITPRFPADLRTAAGSGQAADGAPTGGNAGAPGAGATGDGTNGSAAPSGAVDADLVDLAVFIGQLVRVGGLVVDLTPDGFTLDDGTAVGRVVLTGQAMDGLGLIEPDDALNAIGRVKATSDGFVVVVDAPGGIIVAGDPIPASPSGSAAPAVSQDPVAPSVSADPAARLAGLGDGPWPSGAGLAGIGMLVLVSVLSVLATVIRREQSKRRLASRIATRLAAISGPSAAVPAGTAPERGSSTNRLA